MCLIDAAGHISGVGGHFEMSSAWWLTEIVGFGEP